MPSPRPGDFATRAASLVGGEAIAGGDVCLVVIDPQNDFHEGGALAVPGAVEDTERTAAFLTKHVDRIDSVVVTLDSHQVNHIAHGSFWEKPDDAAARPLPFTVISVEDVAAGKWRARDPALRDWARAYVEALAKGGRFALVVWPEHCVVGTEGHAVREPLKGALAAWCRAKGKSVAYLLKGMNNRSEMYSCFKAEVELDDDPTTKLNAPLIAQIAKHGTVVCCGQAKSHCVNYSVRDMVAAWPEGTPKSNLVLLKDACSPVISFEKAAAEFEADVAAAGVRVTTTDDF